MHCNNGDSVMHCNNGDSVTRCNNRNSVTHCNNGDSVTHCNNGDSVTRCNNGTVTVGTSVLSLLTGRWGGGVARPNKEMKIYKEIFT